MTDLRERLYESYVTTHAGDADLLATKLGYRRDIRPWLRAGSLCLEVGCGQGLLVSLLLADGFDAHGVDISPEQVELAHAAGVRQVAVGDLHDVLDGSGARWDAIIAMDVLEHFDRVELIRTLDQIHAALAPGGVLIARVPNAVSPTGGHIRYGDVTHETWFTARSVAQLASVTGFSVVQVKSSPPMVHGLVSAIRAAVWKSFSGLIKLALAAETGQLRGHIITQNLVFVARKS